MKVTLISHTENAEKVIAAAAKLCYSSEVDVKTLMDGLTPDKTEKFIKKLMDMGHESPFEHASFTFAIEGVSRALLAQITRHRLASFSVRSQRYCAEDKFNTIVPSTIKSKELKKHYTKVMNTVLGAYSYFANEGVPKEDARFVLPNACETRLIVTMNVRELWNFFKQRCCTRAQWEIRAVAYEMLRILKEVSPVIFKNAGPTCIKLGYCPEGKMSCGKAPTMDELLKAYNK